MGENARTCRGCGAEILWVTMATGKRMPVDAGPTPAGTVLLDGPVGAVLGKRALEEARKAGTLLYRSHFATCPQARQFRRGKEGDE